MHVFFYLVTQRLQKYGVYRMCGCSPVYIAIIVLGAVATGIYFSVDVLHREVLAPLLSSVKSSAKPVFTHYQTETDLNKGSCTASGYIASRQELLQACWLVRGGLLGTNPPSPTSSTFFKSTITFLCPQPLQIILLLISLSLSLPQNDIGHATVL